MGLLHKFCRLVASSGSHLMELLELTLTFSIDPWKHKIDNPLGENFAQHV